MAGDWTKGDRWNRATIYRYGQHAQYCHLCFYNDKTVDWDQTADTEWEFEVTEVIVNPDMLCMLYPFADKVALIEQLNAWIDAPEPYEGVVWAASVSRPGGAVVSFHE